MATLTEEEVGKTVVNQDGAEVGRITRVQNGTAHVDPSPGLTDRIKSRLGWEDADEDDFMLESNEVATITDDEVRLR